MIDGCKPVYGNVGYLAEKLKYCYETLIFMLSYMHARF